MEGLYTEKTSTYEEGKGGQITLDTFVTGEVKKVYSSGAPCDIVLVIDMSSSMNASFVDNGGPTRLEAMKDACKDFLGEIKDHSPSDETLFHRVAIVSYNEYFPSGNMGYGTTYYDGTVVWPQNSGDIKKSTRYGYNAYGKEDSENHTNLPKNSNPKMQSLYNYVNDKCDHYFMPVGAVDSNIGQNMTIPEHIVDCFTSTDAYGETACFRGMEEASNLLKGRSTKQYYDKEQGKKVDRPTFVILFTDGIPGQTDPDPTSASDIKFSDEVYSIGYAYNTIAVANQLKKAGTKVYTVGIHPSCNPVPESDLFYIRRQCYSNVMKSYYYYNSSNSEARSYDEAGNCENALNCFLHMTSSNYIGDDVTEYSISDYNYPSVILGKGMDRWAKLSNKNPSELTDAQKTEIINGGHYMSANNPEGLNKVFHDISSEIIEVTVPVPLGPETVIKDFIDNTTFKLPDGTEPGNIEFYTRDIKSITGDENAKIYEFYPAGDPVHTKVPAGVTVNFDEDSQGNEGVTITGFDFKANYVGYDENEKLHGCELEVLIPFEFQDGFEHTDGTYQTNSPESGIYEEGENIQPYPIPRIMIRDINITRKNLEKGESVVYDVYKVDNKFQYDGGELRYRVVLTGTSDDGSEDVTCTITGTTAFESGDYVYWRVQETGWSWAYDLINMEVDARSKIQSFKDSQLKFVFEGPHKPSDSKYKENPVNKLFHAEVNKQQTVPHPNRTNN